MQKPVNNCKIQFLYHYTKKEVLIEKILPSLKLKLNTLCNTNDPKEKKMSFEHFYQQSDFEFVGEFFEIKNKLKEHLDADCQICCFSGDYVWNNQYFEGYNLPRMWATYGDVHKGVCLKIDFEKFCKINCVDNVTVFLRRVRYLNDPTLFLIKKKQMF